MDQDETVVPGVSADVLQPMEDGELPVLAGQGEALEFFVRVAVCEPFPDLILPGGGGCDLDLVDLRVG